MKLPTACPTPTDASRAKLTFRRPRGPLPNLRPTPLALALLGLCASAQAQTAAPAPADNQLPEIAVTAKGYAADTLDTPASIDVIDAQEIRRKGATSLGQALQGEPGLAATSDGSASLNPVVRGLKKESLALMVDGMRLNSAQPYGAIGSFVSLGLAERVEVLRGPASVLYGSGALGGAINVLLPQARFDAGVSGRLGLRAASGDRSVGASGVVNWSGGDHALMLGAAGADHGNYRAGGQRVERTGYEQHALIGQYRYRIDGAQQIRLSLQRENLNDVWYPGSTQPNANPMVGSTTIHSPRQSRQLMEIGYSHKGRGPVNFDARLYRQSVDRTINAWANGPLQRDTTTNDVAFDTTGLDVRADWAANEHHLISVGFNGWRMTGSPDRRIFNNGSYSQKAAFQQIEWQQYSSGSFILGAYFNATEIEAEKTFIDLSNYGIDKTLDMKGVYAYTGGLSLGYSHNFIIYKNFLLNLSAMVGAGYLNTHYSYMPNTRPNENLTGIGSKFSSRIALGYSREKNYFGVYFISDTYEMNLSKSENIQFLVTNYYMFYGRRFDLNKIFSKTKVHKSTL